jgi:hypothetical protein
MQQRRRIPQTPSLDERRIRDAQNLRKQAEGMPAGLREMICYGRLARPKPASPRPSSGSRRRACDRRSDVLGGPPGAAS